MITRKIILTFFTVLLTVTVYSQDSLFAPKFLVRPYVEYGVDFIRNNELKANYNTQSKSFWGIGLQVGHPEQHTLIPYFQYLESNFGIRKATASGVKADSSLKTSQYSIGLVIIVKKMTNVNWRAKLGYSYARIKESFYGVNSASDGFLVGIGVEKKIFKHSRVYLELAYNYQKTYESDFRDFDMIKISVGYIL